MKRQLTLALSVLALSLLFGSTPEEVVTSSFTQNQFKVAWYSSSDEQGYLRYGTSTSSVTTVVYDERGSSDTDKIHSVLVSGLDYDTMYYFSIQSGSTFDDNGGVFYSVKTAQADFSFDPDSISLVNVYSFQSTTAVTKDSIVFATIEKSNGSSESLPISFLYNSSSNSSPYTQTKIGRAHV